MFKYLFSILITLFLSSVIYGQSWNYIGKSSDGSSYFMRSSLTTDSYTKKVWVKHQMPKYTITKKGKKYNYTNAHEILLYEFNCSEKQLLMHSYVTYSFAGKVLDKYEFQEYEKEWRDVIPDSVGEMLLENACSME